MISDAKKMRAAKPGEVRRLLTYMCCFMDAEDAWETKKAESGKHWPRSPTAKSIYSMIVDAAEMRSTLTPFPSKM